MRRSERTLGRGGGLLAVVLATAALALGLSACGSSSGTDVTAQAEAIADVVQQTMQTSHLRAVILKVTKGSRVITERAFGTSMDGVPATTDMHFRNGAVSFAYMSTLLMQFVDERKVGLDDTIAQWAPSLPAADKVTLKMLANQTSGYPDYETDPAWLAAFAADPFHVWTYEERLKYAFERPMQFAPGSNWSLSHTNFMVLGEILAQIGNAPLDTLLQQKVLGPMGLRGTGSTTTSDMPGPTLHTYSAERRVALGVPATITLYEDSTFWNTQWATAVGANESTTIHDMATTAVQVGTGALLSPSSYDAMTGPHLLGFGKAEDACAGSCFAQTTAYNYGLGVVRSGSWILQNPLLSGFGATEAYLPSQKIAIAVAVTLLPQAFDSRGDYTNLSDVPLFRRIGAIVAPKDPPPSTG
jgi:CubicO group peptidase (beta-lactamase class C family)